MATDIRVNKSALLNNLINRRRKLWIRTQRLAQSTCTT
jgi:hypothetical protein